MGGRAAPAARKARLAAGRGAERRTKSLPFCSTSVSVNESSSTRMAGQDPLSAAASAAGLARAGEAVLQLFFQHEGEKAARDLGSNGLVEFVKDRLGAMAGR